MQFFATRECYINMHYLVSLAFPRLHDSVNTPHHRPYV
uniref:Uncharacterized protein n=1 Tax=Anguilla anguilla TaxID=7936 RepID=A0A0E9UI69_ANGAN